MTEQIQIAYIAGIAGLIGAFIGAGASLIGVWVNARNEKERRSFEAKVKEAEGKRWQESKESEEIRWHAQLFLTKEVDTLSHLYASLVEYESVTSSFRFKLLFDRDDYAKEVFPKMSAFSYARALAFVYLDEEGIDILSEVESALNNIFSDTIDMLNEGKDYVDSCGKEWETLETTFGAASVYLKRRLSPLLPESLKTIRKQ